MTKRPIFYVDCFSGKGRFDDGKPGSPIIALDIRKDCIAQTRSENAQIDMCFIDLNYTSDLELNLSSYAFLQKKRFGQIHTYEQWLQPYLVSNTLQLLQSEIPKLRNRIESVQLCFTTDPFMYEFDEIAKMSKDAIRLLNLNGIKCTVLTKGILPLELGDKKNYSMDNEYGITLISLDEKYREKMEPYSAPYQQRIDALKALHDSGCKTWISMDPYPTPNLIDQDINELLEAVSFTDKIIFGRTNYCKEVSLGYPQHKHFYNEKAKQVINFCEKNKIDSYIKEKTITPDI